MIKTLALLAAMFVSGSAMAQSFGSQDPSIPARGPGYNNFTIYNWNVQRSEMEVHDASQYISIIEDQRTGHQTVVLIVPGVGVTSWVRPDTTYIPNCNNLTGFYCSSVPGDVPDRLAYINKAKAAGLMDTIFQAIKKAITP